VLDLVVFIFGVLGIHCLQVPFLHLHFAQTPPFPVPTVQQEAE